jgi:hypothetical protein
MPYPIKSTAGTSTLPVLRKNNYGLIGVNQGGYGSTSSTGFWNGKTPNVGGYIVYVGNGTSSPTMYVLSNSVQLIPLANNLGAGGVGSVVASLFYFIVATNILCINFDVPNIVTNGLIVCYDAGFTPSYPGAYTTWYDLSGNGNNGFLINGPTYSSDGGGSLIFDGSDDYANVSLPGALSYTTITICGFIKWLSFGGDMFLGMSLYDVWTAGNCLGYNNANGNVVGIDAATVTSLGLLGNWKHYTFVMNSSGLLSNNKIYIDGVSVGALTPVVGGDGTIPGFSTNLRLCDWNEGGYYGNLQYGNLQVYNRELTQSEIQQNYYAGLQKLIPTDNLVLWLDGTNTNTRVITPTKAYDMSGNNYDGTFTNGVSLAHRDGGTVFNFDGVDDIIRTEYNGQLGDFTVCVWFKSDNSGNWARLVDKSYSDGLWLGKQFNVPNSWGGGAGPQTTYPYGNFLTLPDGQWNFLVSIRNGSTHTLYGNGITNTVSQACSPVLTSTSKIGIGSWWAGIEYFKGKIGDVRLYSRALTADEVLKMYTATKSRYGL